MKYHVNIIYSLLLILFISLITTSSCTNQKNYVYFQQKTNDTLPIINDTIENYDALLQPDDLISITVSAIDPEVVKPFNLFPTKDANSKLDAGNVSGYLIDANGYIEFPVLGAIKIAGLTRIQATNLLKQRLKEHIKNPIVIIRQLNFKVTILGEVRSPGVYTISHERLSLPEALGLAGDLTISGLRTNILVIREEANKKVETRVDLTSREVFRSPVYYLHQNDIVYIEPTKAKINSGKQTTAYASIGVSVTSLLLNLYILLRK